MTAPQAAPRNKLVHPRDHTAIITPMPKRPIYTNLYVQVLAAIAVGVALGVLAPERAAAMKPLGDGFIKLVKMMIAPIVFTTVVAGIAHMGEMKDVGRIGLRALVYFEAVSTLALVIGLIVVTVLQPGAGVGFDPATADLNSVKAYTTASEHLTTVDFILNVIPDTIVGGFARGGGPSGTGRRHGRIRLVRVSGVLGRDDDPGFLRGPDGVTSRNGR